MLKVFLLLATISTSWAQSIKPYKDQPLPLQRALRIETQLEQNSLSWSLDQENVEGAVYIDVVVQLLNNFHLYEDRVQFETIKPENKQNLKTWEIEVVERPESVKFFDPVSKKLVKGYKGQALFKLKLNPGSTEIAKYSNQNGINLVTTVQACDDKVCLLPAKILSNVKILGKSNLQNNTIKDEPNLFSVEKLESLLSAEESGAIVFLILFLAGLLTAFTPCVYPIYPITIGIFTKWSKEEHSSPMALSLLYCLGMSLSYAVLGLFTSATGKVFGAYTQSPVFLISMGLILLLSAVFMSGVINFSLPVKLINLVSSSTEGKAKSPAKKSFLMGASLGIVASPCVGPMLIALLSWVSLMIANQEQNAYLMGFTYLSFFGFGMSFPFLVLAFAIQKMHIHPSFGKFTPWFKNIGALLLVASSLYFLIPGFKYLSMDSGAQKAATFSYPVLKINEVDESKARVIDFRADWCAACIELENKTFTTKKVSDHFNNSELQFSKVDLTVMTPELEKVAQDYSVLSLPTVLFINKEGEVCKNLSVYEFIDEDEFIRRLDDECMN